ncbi:anaerobic glycerol-3-phosphate dehydrogenase subunit C, partial [Halobacteriales archaeon SW_10_68_16]
MSDGDRRGDARDPSVPATDGGVDAEAGGEFDPVEVFPESDDFDLRPGADSCFKCSTCDTNCPVAAVDDDFPGPKFQGPEQWRLKRATDGHEIDDSVMDCSNCMRCDNACPAGVPLSQMHNTARGEYVSEQMDMWSVEYWRNRVLSNYRTSAWLASKMPRLANVAMNFGPARWVMEKAMG